MTREELIDWLDGLARSFSTQPSKFHDVIDMLKADGERIAELEALTHMDGLMNVTVINALKEENQRLREALEKIYKWNENRIGAGGVSDCDGMIDMICEEVLGAEKKEN